MLARLHTLACLGAVSVAVAASASQPPSYFDPRHAPVNVRSADLQAPRPLSETFPHVEGDIYEHTQRHHQSRAQVRRQVIQGPAEESSSNPNDKLQTLGYLGGAYNIPLNVSSSPPQLVFVQLDTGSSDLWLVSASCRSAQCEDANILKFDESKSASYQPLTLSLGGAQSVNVSSSSSSPRNGPLFSDSQSRRVSFSKRQSADVATTQVPFSIAYEDETAATGLIAKENFTISDLGVSDQLFALVNQTNVTLSSQGISGVMGFGFPRGSVIARSLINYEDQLGGAKNNPLAFSLLQGSDLSYPLFGLSLGSKGGRITFGALDPTTLPTPADRGQIEWHDVVPFPSGNTALPAISSLNRDGEALGAYVSWTLRLTDAGADGQSANLRPTYSAVGRDPLALLDTGTMSIVGPPAGVQAIFSRIVNARHVGGGRFVVPCDTRQKMYFSFGGRNITLLPEDYIIGPASSQPQLCFAWPAAIEPSNDGVDWVLGTPFLRAVYSAYSIGINGKEPPKVGLYPLRQPADATDPAVVFAPVPTDSVSRFLKEQATSTVASIIPNSLVSVPMASTMAYAFANATSTATVGAVPTQAGAPSSYVPALTAQGGLQSVPAISSSIAPLPLPSNPAAPEQNNAASASRPRKGGLAVLSLLLVVVAASLQLL